MDCSIVQDTREGQEVPQLQIAVYLWHRKEKQTNRNIRSQNILYIL